MQTFIKERIFTKLNLLTLVATLVSLYLLFGTESSTAAGNLVPCDGPDCSMCSLVQMGNTVIKWMFGIIFLIFAFIMASAGWGLVTSAGNSSELNAAKSKFKNALIGLIIVLAAWLFVDTIMVSLVGDQSDPGNTGGVITGWGPWKEVKCQVQEDPTPFVDLNTGNGGSNPYTPSGTPQDPNSTVAGACKVPALSPITDPLALSMESGNSLVYNNNELKTCAEKFVAEVGGGAKINSAYRPPEYQNHLWEIRDRWCTKGLRNISDPSCSALKSAIGNEVNKHFGGGWQCGAVGKTSKHTSGMAVDIGGISNHNDPTVKAKADANCLVWKNYPNDPVHYDMKPSCTCS